MRRWRCSIPLQLSFQNDTHRRPMVKLLLLLAAQMLLLQTPSQSIAERTKRVFCARTCGGSDSHRRVLCVSRMRDIPQEHSASR